jgi:uncharacterized protein (DUF736 family)
MATIGKLKAVRDGQGSFLVGQLRTLEITLNLKLYPITAAQSAKSPAYRIFAIGRDNAEVEIGAAWKKTMTNPDKFGEEFLSLTIDDPSLPQSLNVAAFKEPDGETWLITFRRRQAK